jgi:hypothetical protein
MGILDTIGDVVAGLDPSKVADFVNGLSSKNEMVAQVNSLLLQVQRDPASASQVSTSIITMRGIPGVVRDLAGQLPVAARDASGVQLAILVSQIQMSLPHSRWGKTDE